jgi:influenza virus NS1A-binding protein
MLLAAASIRGGLRMWWRCTTLAQTLGRSAPPLPQGRAFLGAATVAGKLYVVGGRNGAEIFSSLEEYDPTTNTWRSRADMPDTRYSFGTAAAGGRIYVIGGQSTDPGPCPCRGWEIVNSLLEYDPVRDRWDTMTPMADPRWRLAAVGVGPNVYAIGGWSPELDTLHDRVEAYDFARGEWAMKRAMPTPRGGLAVAARGGRIYAVGGRDGLQLLDVAEVYDTGLPFPVNDHGKAPAAWAQLKGAYNERSF